MLQAPLPILCHAEDVLNLEAGKQLPGCDLSATEALRDVAHWAYGFLSKAHTDVGRNGPVCPWVPVSLARRQFFLTVLPVSQRHPEAVDSVMLRLRDLFLELEPTQRRDAQFKTIVVLFTGASTREGSALVRAAHERLKPAFLERGLMLGEFYLECDKPGLRNWEFRPLRFDTPLLVIRSMVLLDVAFLADQTDFVRAYLRHFDSEGMGEIQRILSTDRPPMTDEGRALLRTFAESGPG